MCVIMLSVGWVLLCLFVYIFGISELVSDIELLLLSVSRVLVVVVLNVMMFMNSDLFLLVVVCIFVVMKVLLFWLVCLVVVL